MHDHMTTPMVAKLRAFCLGAVVASVALLATSNADAGDLRRTLFARPVFMAADSGGTDSTGVHGGETFAASDAFARKLGEGPPGAAVHIPLYYSLPIIAALVTTSGLFSGLTIGLMGLDVIGLQIVERGGDANLARCAKRIAPLRENGNMLLCTLLFGNVAANSAMSIMTADIADGLLGFVISTLLIVIFAEVVPMACCGRYPLQIGAATVPFVKVMLCLFWIFTKPMSMILDKVLGQEIGTVFNRTELMEMLKLQISLGAVNEQDGEMAKQVAEGALSFRDKSAEEIMQPMEDIYMLSAETRLGYDTIREIFETGFSRVPVYGTDKHDYIGLLYTKDLMLADPEDEMRLGDFIPIFKRKVETFFRNTKLIDALNAFKKGGTHMGLVRETNTAIDTDPRFEIVGLVTLEDIMEEIIQAEIVDETDVYVDVDRGIRVGDGREKEHLNLGVFDPVWKTRRERLSPDEMAAVTAHLSRTVFSGGSDMLLSKRAVEWLVASSAVSTRQRSTALGIEVPDQEDLLYSHGQSNENCTLVLQGRVGMVVGRDGFRAEAGAFSVLAKDALWQSGCFYPDFSAHISTREVRYLCISRAQFLKAREFDKDPEALHQAWCSLAALSAGELSRKEARELRLVWGVESPRARFQHSKGAEKGCPAFQHKSLDSLCSTDAGTLLKSTSSLPPHLGSEDSRALNSVHHAPTGQVASLLTSKPLYKEPTRIEM